MFTDCGLRDELEGAGKKGIGNNVYRGFPNQISTANALDSKL
jgi:hypothetical protein